MTFGVAAVLVAAARDRGVVLQERLWADWRGPPTATLMLSTSPSPSPHLARHRAHARRLLPSLEQLTDERDHVDPVGSSETIERFVAHLRERTRDGAKFPIVSDANADYGFRRNVLGLRPVGLAVSAAAIAISAIALGGVAVGAVDRDVRLLGAAVVASASAVVWWWRLSPRWVRVQADRYAKALLDAAEVLDPTDVGAPVRGAT